MKFELCVRCGNDLGYSSDTSCWWCGTVNRAALYEKHAFRLYIFLTKLGLKCTKKN